MLRDHYWVDLGDIGSVSVLAGAVHACVKVRPILAVCTKTIPLDERQQGAALSRCLC